MSDEDRRRALSSLLPPTRQGGDRSISAVLFAALARAAETDADTLTHGFHSWPARMHPAIPAALLDGLSVRGTVVDCFCGGGTTLVEARRRGLFCVGVDLNPLAARVAEVRTDVRDEAARMRFRASLLSVVERSKERVRKKVPVRAQLSPEEVRRYDPHVLLELAGLLDEISQVEPLRDRRALAVTFSSIVTKVSRQRSDTDEREGQKRIGRFIPSEMFEKKGLELLERWASLAAACPPGSPVPQLFTDDALHLPQILRGKKAQLILTSPPYGGTYDYARHHAHRLAWLQLSEQDFERRELGSRRRSSTTSWDDEVVQMLQAMAASLAPGGSVVLLMGDGELQGRRMAADEQLQRLGGSARLRVVASASAPRLDWRGGAERSEHLVLLRAT